MNPKVSIVIPVYNAENTVRRTVESLIYGEEKNIEIILVEDCSKDKSWEVCQELCSEFQNVCCVRNDKNRGVSYTRNHGIRETTAPYIMFVDSDDWVSVKYISKMLDALTEFENSLPVCGFHFWNQVNECKTDYLWDKDTRQLHIEISGTELFDAVDRIMIQSCCNKIFKREVIEKNHIQFDESQNMGEDFEFVLDYMFAANIHKCVIINEPLYYYIRANHSSLMSNFGWTSNENEWKRMEKLAKICGENIETAERLEVAKQHMNENLIYHVVRTSHKSKKEKLKRIEEIMQDGKCRTYYRKQKILMRKEWITERILYLKIILVKKSKLDGGDKTR